MGKFWVGFVDWWQGKKTILGGVLIIAGGVAGVWFGKLDPTTGLTIVGVGVSIAGWANKANRHQAEILAALQGVEQAGSEVRAGKPVATALQDAASSTLNKTTEAAS